MHLREQDSHRAVQNSRHCDFAVPKIDVNGQRQPPGTAISPMSPLAIMTREALPLNLGVRLPRADRARDTITTISWSARILCSEPITDGIIIAEKISTREG